MLWNKYKKWLIAALLLGFFIIIPSLNNDGGQNRNTEFFTTNIDMPNKTILSLPEYDAEIETVTAVSSTIGRAREWLAQNFNVWKMYQNLANPSSRYVVLNSGLRKEEIANILSRELKWNLGTKLAFLTTNEVLEQKNIEGHYNPGGYLLPLSTTPDEARNVLSQRFRTEIESKYATSTANVINLDKALRIGSIIEREASGTRDMRLISGIIWNRIFKNMGLEMDATLQYAKGNNKIGWWPQVKPEDKYIDSPYNTYQNKGLPPTPISNVSIAALKAALNPKKTDCIFYLHDRSGNIHCSVSYKEHLANIKRYYK